jgi:tRNA (guanine26-N2/guanine27-N2)-dimethyltransferase
MKEIGLRILIGFLVREGIKYDKGVKPILSYSFGHYFRTYIKVLNGVKEGNDSLAKIGWVCKNGKNDKNKNGNDKNGGNWIIGREFPAAKEWAGPLWIGKLHDKSIIQKLLVYAREKELGKKEEARKMLDIFLEEADATPLFYLTDEISSSLKLEQLKLSFIIDRLKERGFDACRTHFSPIGFKTNADMKEIEKIWNAQFVGKNG